VKPKIYRDDFWGDVANALLLAPPYRKPVQPLSEKVEERLAHKKKYVPPPPPPKIKPVVLHQPHKCSKYDWEYDDDGNRVPEDTLVSCPECGQWWMMINKNMKSLDPFERVQVRLYLKLKKLGF
jgi:hypothetical protein